MRKKATRTFIAVLLVTAMTGITVFADDYNTLKKQEKQAQSEYDALKNDLTYILAQMNDLQDKMVEVSIAMEQVTVELQDAQNTQKQQYQDMKLRIKYMYEDQDSSIMESLLSSESMSEVLNKAEYMQKVYDYDRQKLEEMATTSKTISDKKAQLTQQQNDLIAFQTELTNKQELLYTAINEKQAKIENFPALLAAATEAAAKKAREDEAATIAAASFKATLRPTGDQSIGQAVVSLAYSFIGVPYVSAGSSPAGFDCSGFTSYLYRQYGITLSRTTGGQMGSGERVANLSEALPGDIICYPGHVGLYIGNGQIIHASVPGSTVKVASATGINLRIQAIVRYW